MTIKQRKLMLHFLELLAKEFEIRKVTEIDTVFLQLIPRKELIKIVLWLFTNYDRSMLTEKTDAELLELIGDDSCLLSYIIQKWKDGINAVPKLTQDEVNDFFNEKMIDIHYLRSKPVEEWDSYDVSNYYSILFKRGKTQRVYAIFTSDVKDEDKYAVTTQPSFFFDTEDEAEEELERICIESKRLKSDFIIHSLWRIT
ncbi:hypothetical protein [Polaribacter cellanae]|uniref:Uncharacterized protein n=1 Tax=Polaribacter cellanae TaxID=2818493 RepID=A0A975CPE5_9FLAO|nr:hypothetical protein [Polaribacter cellanae]QTE23318.1 hypothetical protein J3359_03300 [Polaribacter cellanae]